jgi:tetraacyldisaccharide 4'-kinase
MKIILIPFSYVFRFIVFVRNSLYKNGILKVQALDSKVISVGNIAAGGTGKTPFVEIIARYFLEKGKFVVIILKGYMREHDDIKVVELGFRNEKHELTTETIGDEAFLLLENLSGAAAGRGLIVVGDDKTKAAKFAATKFKPEIIIIDDGFQHRKLARDLDIVIINPGMDKRLIPAGKLREPLRNIFRADLLVVNNKFDKDAIAENTKNKPRVVCNYEFEGFLNIKNDKAAGNEIEAVAFCGIGDPESYKKLLTFQNVKLNDFIIFPDHHNFSIDDINKIISSYSKTGAKYILTTQKDFARIKNSELVLNTKSDNVYKSLLYNYPLYYAKIKMQINSNEELLYNRIEDILKLI